MHAWEAIQKTLDYIEVNSSEEIDIEQLAKEASLSLFYYQR
jgi:AraC family transcriptional regulator